MKIENLTVYCNDIGACVEFYSTVFGFRIVRERQPVPDVKLALIERDGLTIELLERVGAPRVVFSDFTASLGFGTTHIEEEYEKLKSLGVRIKSPLRNIGPKARLFEIFDPSGFPLYVIQEDTD